MTTASPPTTEGVPAVRQRAAEGAGRQSHLTPKDDAWILAIDPSGTNLALALGTSLHLVRCEDPPQAGALLTPVNGIVRCIAFNPAGTSLLSGSDDKRVQLWDVHSRSCTHSWSHNKKMGCVAFSGDGCALFADRFGEIYVISLNDPNAAPILRLGHLSPVSKLAFAPPLLPPQLPPQLPPHPEGHREGAADGTPPLLISADREGHVRASRWPLVEVIER